jgi:hypothetical protein
MTRTPRAWALRVAVPPAFVQTQAHAESEWPETVFSDAHVAHAEPAAADTPGRAGSGRRRDQLRSPCPPSNPQKRSPRKSAAAAGPAASGAAAAAPTSRYLAWGVAGVVLLAVVGFGHQVLHQAAGGRAVESALPCRAAADSVAADARRTGAGVRNASRPGPARGFLGGGAPATGVQSRGRAGTLRPARPPRRKSGWPNSRRPRPNPPAQHPRRPPTTPPRRRRRRNVWQSKAGLRRPHADRFPDLHVGAVRQAGFHQPSGVCGAPRSWSCQPAGRRCACCWRSWASCSSSCSRPCVATAMTLVRSLRCGYMRSNSSRLCWRNRMAAWRASCGGWPSSSSTVRALRRLDSKTSRSTCITPRSRRAFQCVTSRARATICICGKCSRARSTILSDCSMSSTDSTRILAVAAPAVRSRSSRVASP